MRCCHRLPSQRACSMFAAWTSTSSTRGCQQINASAASKAASTTRTTAAGRTPAQSGEKKDNSSNGADKTSTTVQGTDKASLRATTVNVSSSAVDERSEKVIPPSTMEATAVSGEAVAEATERLRAALRVLSIVERAKSDEKKLKLAQLLEGVSPVEVEPESEEDMPLTASKEDVKSAIPPPSATAEETGARHHHGSRSSSKATSPVSWSSATSLWVRNKQSKFWAIVNETTAEGHTTNGGVTQRQDEGKGSAESPASPPPSTHTAPSTAETAFTSPKTQSASTHSPWASTRETSSTGAAKVMTSTSTESASHRPTPVTAQSIRASSSAPPFRSRYKKDVAHALSELLNCDPAFGSQLLGQLSAESRRLMLIMGTASEYFGVDYGEVVEQIKEADTDRDNSISSKEFDAWVGHMAGLASTRRHDAPAKAETGKEKQSKSSSPSSLSETPTSTTATGATGVVTKSSQSAKVQTSLQSTPKRPAAFVQTPPTSSKTPVPFLSHAQKGTGAYFTSITIGSSSHPVALSATLSRQRAEMAISTARAASARIIEVMQKNMASLQPPMSTPALAKTASPNETVRQPPTPTPSPQAVSQAGQAQKQPQQPSSTSPPHSVPTSMMAAAPAGLTDLIISKPFPAGSLDVERVPCTKCADAPPVHTAFTNPITTSTAAKEVPKVKKGHPAYIPWSTFVKIVLAAAPPFLAFGMLDNCTLVLAGGAIDNILSAKLGLTHMAAAGLGGVVSGVAGIQVHGLAERFTRANPPRLTAMQERSNAYLRAENVGNTLGMVVGLILGMTPLLFMRRSSLSEEEEEAEHKRFREEAVRSHQRRCKKVEKSETQARQALEKEEHAEREATVKAASA